MADIVTGAVIATAYAVLAWITYRTIPVVSPELRPARRFLATVAVTWSAWYIYLAAFTPPLFRWQVQANRALHLPLIVAIGLTIWVGKLRE